MRSEIFFSIDANEAPTASWLYWGRSLGWPSPENVNSSPARRARTRNTSSGWTSGWPCRCISTGIVAFTVWRNQKFAASDIVNSTRPVDRWRRWEDRSVLFAEIISRIRRRYATRWEDDER